MQSTRIISRFKGFTLLAVAHILLFGCNGPQTLSITLTTPPLDVIETQIFTQQIALPTSTSTANITPTITVTPNPTVNQTPTPISSPTLSPTPTSDLPQVRVLMQAFCRYGPGKAYLYSHGLYEGDFALVEGRNATGTWLWIQPQNLDRHCWMAASVAEISGEVRRVPIVTTRLPHSTLYGSPKNIQAHRNGDQVTITWDPVWMTEDDDRGYLIEANLCQNGTRFFVAIQTNKPKYTFTDSNNCASNSSGKLYTVEKHGYTDPVIIPWP